MIEKSVAKGTPERGNENFEKNLRQKIDLLNEDIHVRDLEASYLARRIQKDQAKINLLQKKIDSFSHA